MPIESSLFSFAQSHFNIDLGPAHTLVRLLNRLIEPSSGTIEIDGRNLNQLDAAELRKLRNQRMSMVFQHFALLPHRTCQTLITYLACTTCQQTGDVTFHHWPAIARGTGQLDLMRRANAV